MPTLRFSDIDREDFLNYMLNERRVSEKWARSVLRLLERYIDRIDIDEVRDAFQRCTNRRDFVLAVRVLIHYLRERKMIDRETAAEFLEARFLKAIRSNPREVYLSDAEIVEGLELISKKWGDDTAMLYRFLVYTGTRLLHAVRALNEYDRKNLEIRGNVAIYPMTHVATGREKRAFIALMPAEFGESLKAISISYKSISDRLIPRRWKPPVDSRIDANAIRKWHMNFLIRHGVDSAIANFIQGRAPEDIGSARYLAKRERAIEAYSKIVDKFPI